jgi:hypothetical protein
MSIASALLVSVTFWLLQERYQPFRSPSCNTQQSVSMGVLCALYFCGLLMHVDAVEEQEKESLGVLLIAMLAVVAVSVAGLAHAQKQTAMSMFRLVQHDFSITYRGRILHHEGHNCKYIASFPVSVVWVLGPCLLSPLLTK